MTILQAMEERHSVRSYLNKKIEPELIKKLQTEIDSCNKEGGLHIQMVINEPKAFDGFMAHYGKFRGVQNYVALIGKKAENLDERIGYYGEKIALLAQTLGLNTCWVAMTFSKGITRNKCRIDRGEKLVCVLALGYGETQGVCHKSKSPKEVSNITDSAPDWFKKGMQAAMLAPTAVNQQKFFITLAGNTVMIKSTGGFYSKVDLGIVKYHFEVGAGAENFIWK